MAVSLTSDLRAKVVAISVDGAEETMVDGLISTRRRKIKGPGVGVLVSMVLDDWSEFHSTCD